MSKPQKFRKKPVVIEAMEYDGTNADQLIEFMGGTKQANAETKTRPGPGRGVHQELVIHTLEGDMSASLNDWIIRGVQGEFYPCKPDIFAATYEREDRP